MGCDTPPIIENLHFVGQNPSKILSIFGHYKIVIKKLLFNFPFFLIALARENAVSVAQHSLRHLERIQPGACAVHEQQLALFSLSCARIKVEIFATKLQSEFDSSVVKEMTICGYTCTPVGCGFLLVCINQVLP